MCDFVKDFCKSRTGHILRLVAGPCIFHTQYKSHLLCLMTGRDLDCDLESSSWTTGVRRLEGTLVITFLWQTAGNPCVVITFRFVSFAKDGEEHKLIMDGGTVSALWKNCTGTLSSRTPLIPFHRIYNVPSCLFSNLQKVAVGKVM